MRRSQTGTVLQRIHVLFQPESLAGLSDCQLLERFLADRDEASELAFTALVQRHGRMVLGVCRRILDDPDEAEDAFQATFLVLVRKARSIRVEGSVGRWLYGVATRVASRGRARSLRRGARETGGVELLIAPTLATPSEFEDLRAVLADELNRLPVRFQMTLALCDVEGLTHEEAARRLGLPVGTIKSRLSRARRRLRSRLTRRGLTPAELFGAGCMLRIHLPEVLVDSTVRLGQHFLAGQTRLVAMSTTSTSVAALTQGVIQSMFFTKLKIAVLACAVLAAGGALMVHQTSAQRQSPERGPEGRTQAQQSPKAAGSPASGDELDVLMLERAWLDALGRADKSVVNRILADDFLGVDASGGEISKALYLQAVADAAFGPAPIEPSQLKVRVFDETAVLRNRARLKENTPEIRYSKLYVKRQGRWQCVASHETEIRDAQGMMFGYGGMMGMMKGRMGAMGGMMGRGGMTARGGMMGMKRGQMGEAQGNTMMMQGMARPPLAPERLTVIRPRLECLLEKLYVQTGQAVKKGDPLLDLFSTELAKAKNEYLVRKIQWENDRRNLELRQKLVNTGAISNQVWVDSENQESKSKLEFQTAGEELNMLGLDDASIARVGEEKAEQKARMTLRSPVAGNVSELRAAVGSLYGIRDVLLVIEPNSDDAMKQP